MGKKKDEKAVESIKQYLSNISKREREQIQRELERDAEDSEEEPQYQQISFVNAPMSFKLTTNQVRYFSNAGWAAATVTGSWLNTEQKAEIEEEAQDVSFED